MIRPNSFKDVSDSVTVQRSDQLLSEYYAHSKCSRQYSASVN